MCTPCLTMCRWLWRRWRWRWRWWWSSRGGTFPPCPCSPSSQPRLVAQILLQLPSWRWTVELLLRVPSRPRRLISSARVVFLSARYVSSATLATCTARKRGTISLDGMSFSEKKKITKLTCLPFKCFTANRLRGTIFRKKWDNSILKLLWECGKIL